MVNNYLFLHSYLCRLEIPEEKTHIKSLRDQEEDEDDGEYEDFSQVGKNENTRFSSTSSSTVISISAYL